MSKYIKLFENEEAYNTALPTLDLPSVSLIDDTGIVKYNSNRVRAFAAFSI